MSGMDRNVILRQMGITQWVLRDAGQQASAPEKQDEQVGLGAATEAAAPRKVSPSVTVEASPEKTRDADIERPEVALTLESLRQQVNDCTACELAQSRTRAVFGEGPESADWLFVGEAPGQQEDRQGKPFVGRAGGLLTQMLLALGQPREQVFIANVLKCRPPNNRDPLPKEIRACEVYLLKQIELVRPRVMVALGRISAQALLDTDQPLGKLRGRVHHYGPSRTPLIVTYHPAYLLRQPADKGKVWADLLLAHRQIPL